MVARDRLQRSLRRLVMQGASLLGLIDRSARAWREALLVEQELQCPVPGFTPPMRMRTLVTGRHRLSVYEEHGEGELYDLEADPDELRA
ncbi:MAG: hypothetical protein ACT4P4_27765 [Betaproteobacteria bacterium]